MISLGASIASTFQSFHVIEQNIPLWPPTLPLSTWFYRIFVAPWWRWDTTWYEIIILRGYHPEEGTVQFHPLFPGLSALFNGILHDPLLSMVLVSSTAGLLMVWAYIALGALDLGTDNRTSITTLIILLSFPASYILFVPYSESLFLLLAILAFYFSRRKKWWASGVCGALAVLTRQQGLFLVIPILVDCWEDKGKNLKQTLAAWREWSSVLLIPLALVLWSSYRGLILNDFHPNTSSVHSFIYSVIISPGANVVVPQQSFLWPWQSLAIAIQKAISAPDIDMIVNLTLAALFLLLLVMAWKNLRLSYRLYSLAIVMVSLSYYTGPIHPYMGLPRHLLLAFPVFIGLVERLQQPWQRLLYTCVGTTLIIFLTWLHVLGIWVP